MDTALEPHPSVHGLSGGTLDSRVMPGVSGLHPMTLSSDIGLLGMSPASCIVKGPPAPSGGTLTKLLVASCGKWNLRGERGCCSHMPDPRACRSNITNC